jgi:hypothetical protein
VLFVAIKIFPRWIYGHKKTKKVKDLNRNAECFSNAVLEALACAAGSDPMVLL